MYASVIGTSKEFLLSVLLDLEQVVSNLNGIGHSPPEYLLEVLQQAMKISVDPLFEQLRLLRVRHLELLDYLDSHPSFEYDIKSITFILLVDEIGASFDLGQVYMAQHIQQGVLAMIGE